VCTLFCHHLHDRVRWVIPEYNSSVALCKCAYLIRLWRHRPFCLCRSLSAPAQPPQCACASRCKAGKFSVGFQGVTSIGSTLVNAKLGCASFAGTELTATSFGAAVLEGAGFLGGRIGASDFSNAAMCGASFRGVRRAGQQMRVHGWVSSAAFVLQELFLTARGPPRRARFVLFVSVSPLTLARHILFLGFRLTNGLVDLWHSPDVKSEATYTPFLIRRATCFGERSCATWTSASRLCWRMVT
jgi:hypothetical protein